MDVLEHPGDVGSAKDEYQGTVYVPDGDLLKHDKDADL